MSVPRVSILMAVHNGERTVRDAVESMLRQTFGDFELVVVDDGSNDGTAAMLAQIPDARLRVIKNAKNMGLSASLNRGWELCRGEFVARMDADDLSMPGRLAMQVAFLEAHSATAAVGGFVETFSEDGPGAIVRYPTSPKAVAATLLFRSALAHPAVMMRKECFDGARLRFEEEFRYAQDYALWLNCAEKGLGLANVGEAVLQYRVHAGQLSHSMERMQGEGTIIRSRFVGRWMNRVSEEELVLHDAIARDQLVASDEWLNTAASWLERLGRTNEERPCFQKEALARVLTGRYVSLLRFADKAGLPRPEGCHTFFEPYIQANALTAR
jgi:hypothetical protein